MQGMQVWSLVRELGAYMLCGAVKKKKKKKKLQGQFNDNNKTKLI